MLEQELNNRITNHKHRNTNDFRENAKCQGVPLCGGSMAFSDFITLPSSFQPCHCLLCSPLPFPLPHKKKKNIPLSCSWQSSPLSTESSPSVDTRLQDLAHLVLIDLGAHLGGGVPGHPHLSLAPISGLHFTVTWLLKRNVQGLPCASTAGDSGSIPGQGT